MPLIPTRFRPERTEVTAAIDAMDGSGVAPIPGSVVSTPKQKRAAMLARRIGFIGQSYRFTAWQAARCPLTVEHTVDGSRWETVDPGVEIDTYMALAQIQGRRMSQAELVNAAVYLDDTVGEFMLCLDQIGHGQSPAYSVRSSEATKAEKRAGFAGRNSRNGYLVSDAPGGDEKKKTAHWLPADRVFRHWNPSPEYELLATSSLLEILDDVEAYWTLKRVQRRLANSRLAMNDILWTPTEAHVPRPGPNGAPSQMSELEYQFAQAAAARLNDLEDMNVSSAAPFLLKTPGGGTVQKPEILEMPGLTSELLEHIQDARRTVADALPLSSSAAIASEADSNHWDSLLGAEQDVEVIEDRLTRVGRSFTEGAFRPILRALLAAGVWDGDPDSYRIGADLDPIRRRPDNSANAKVALDAAAIGFEAFRRELHFDETDKPSELEVRQILTIAALRSGKLAPGFDDGSTNTGDRQTPVNAGPPELAPAPGETGATEVVASVWPVLDDRWLLTR